MRAVHAGSVSVMVARPLSRQFDYRVDGSVAEGTYVSVPFGERVEAGVVWGPASGAIPAGRLKDVALVSDLPPMTDRLRTFLGWVASYCMTPLGSVLKMALPVPDAFASPPVPAGYAVADPQPEDVRITPARQRVVDVLHAADGALPAAEIRNRSGASSAVLRGMVKAGLLVDAPLPPTPSPVPAFSRPDLDLSPPQREASDALVRSLEGQNRHPMLLTGVTGSGKTEVYFEAIATCLARGRQVLVLLPEIALGPQWFSRFTERFGESPTRWHSGLSPAERRRAWRAIAGGRAPVVVGARSALFLPFPDLGLIVVDEEHDASYKQDEQVIYNARDMAVARAAREQAMVVLVSATPSLETHVNVRDQRYGSLVLPQRHGEAELPDIETVDMRRHRPAKGQWLAEPVVEAAAAALARDEQVLFFLNRRGYAPLTLCNACGARLSCTKCSTWLVDHRHSRVLSCHHCAYRMPRPDVCPACGVSDSLVACGPGVERIEEEVRERFPEAIPEVMTSDTMRNAADFERLVQAMEAGRVDILIGTQMVAKGHHFPNLTLVGVVDADLGLGGADLRAGERTFQLLTQVSGRAGRGRRRGRVLMQTWDPAHPVMQAFLRGDGTAFRDMEAEAREEAGMPPFGRLAALIVTARKLEAAEAYCRALLRSAPDEDGIEVLGPAPAPLFRLRGRYRLRFLVRCRRNRLPQAYVRRWLGSLAAPSGVRVKVDIDPYSFL